MRELGPAHAGDDSAPRPTSEVSRPRSRAHGESIRIRDRPLRMDVNDTRLSATELVGRFHDSHTDVEAEIITSNGLRSGRTALNR
ncbi:hypothetical protein SAMN02982929_00800 [Saccharopolyspora kobensis]|uniref:Uncharacterized protein n=1 Tax=Saccharopolyspora kobensis TaxID=146035 RepID=A0A1H5V8M0_9PSEU|nr:hypothetical protein SAMN02982929_00800 [Saccharopolyspora kobensis]SFC63915.1 hypothetical protein SAMN05216506_1011270 [Saccharopolyspora kobensis]